MKQREPRGIVLLALLLALALMGIALLGAVDVWSLARQRERERELLFVGEQYRQAIRRYWLAAPAGTQRALPSRLELLLDDDRYPIPVHHLRRLYPDPITGHAEWGLLTQDDAITGVYSLSEAPPIKQAGFPPADAQFEGQSRYRDWVFAFVVPRRGSPIPTTPVAPPSPTRGKRP